MVHQVAGVLVALGQFDLNTVQLCEPLGILVLRLGDRGSLSDPSAFAVHVLDVLWLDDAHLSEQDKVQARALDELLEASSSSALG